MKKQMDKCKAYGVPPDLEMGLVSISPVCGCSGGCQYCYLCLRDLNKVCINAFGIADTMEWLRSHPDFSAGEHGNILCMGSWGEIFPHDHAVRASAFTWIQQLLALGNPMVIVTKAHISANEASVLASFQQYPHQLMVMETVTTMAQAKEIEPGCCSAEQRFHSLRHCTQCGLDAALLINPYLKGVTDAELDSLFLQCKIYGIQDVSISPLYYNGAIAKKLSQCGPLRSTYNRLCRVAFDGTQGLHTKEGSLIADPITDDYPYIDLQAKKYGIRVFYHYLCVLSRQYHRKNEILEGNPIICKNCGHCLTFDLT